MLENHIEEAVAVAVAVKADVPIFESIVGSCSFFSFLGRERGGRRTLKSSKKFFHYFWQFISENAVFLHAAVHFDIIVFFQKFTAQMLCVS